MTSSAEPAGAPPKSTVSHVDIVGALMMREMTTRYGREGLGFLWLIGEPLLFCFGVLAMWSLLRSEYEHGIRLAPFVMTGYMSLLLIRHMVSHSMSALEANAGLLYHRRITPIHLYFARGALDFAGTTVAFLVVYATLFATGNVELPTDPLLLYSGWLLLVWLSFGIALNLSALAMRFAVLERIIPVMMYLVIPVSGAFTMAAWLPAAYRDIYLLIPIPHTVEMIREAVFGEFVETYYSPVYVAAWALVLNFSGFVLLANAKSYLDVE